MGLFQSARGVIQAESQKIKSVVFGKSFLSKYSFATTNMLYDS